MKPIYFDYAATTPLDKRVAEKMFNCLTKEGHFGNPSSLHHYGREAKELIENARQQVANTIHAKADEIIWTSGATEADNLALKGAAYLYKNKGKHIVTMKTEHKAVLDTCQHLEKQGFLVTYLSPLATGLLDIDEFRYALREDTILVSIMHINNETGVTQDIDAIANITSSRGIILHVDAAQSPGKKTINMQKTPIDLLSLCAHKSYGPKGIGALYLRKKPRIRVEPLIHGGGHEQGMRSGTLATHQIVGMGEALYLAQEDNLVIKKMRDNFLNGLNAITNMKVNGEHTVPHILNLRFEGMMAQAILDQLPEIACSTSSACQGKGNEGSYVLRAMGLNDHQVKSSLRFSFGRFTKDYDIDLATHAIRKIFNVNNS
jgi:cysteine desulfurase